MSAILEDSGHENGGNCSNDLDRLVANSDVLVILLKQ
ncbi:hypothetical protein CPS_2744 [Colwellia psychrerythraea 34H]|uniref:Uncharacterized protein n=1 Tax=Colwellia psychrerythraea (strain 34H / ATCC BAA-681) TaxID=167879 RepID=Q480R3_COLP3|nr:hypothetical protein CPS_2744 [Colwellia psychrerythraea 34H]